MPEGARSTPVPMHPQIRQVGPGSCPICGMALEPETVSLDDGPNEELVDMTRLFWVGLVLTLPVFALEMGGHLTGLTERIGQQNSNWIQFALATPVVLWCRVALLRARLSVGGPALAQHVHPDRHRHRRRMGLLGGGHPRAGPVSGRPKGP